LDSKVIEVNDEFEETESIKPKVKNAAKPEYDMDFDLSNLDGETKYTNEDRIRIFKEMFDKDVIDIKIPNFLKPSFKVSMIREDNKRIKVLQVSNNKVISKVKPLNRSK
jgi:hypothetical protein